MTQDYVPAQVPRVGDVISIMLQISTFGVLAVCISKIIITAYSCYNQEKQGLIRLLVRRTQAIQRWTMLPLAMWRKTMQLIFTAMSFLTDFQ